VKGQRALDPGAVSGGPATPDEVVFANRLAVLSPPGACDDSETRFGFVQLDQVRRRGVFWSRSRLAYMSSTRSPRAPLPCSTVTRLQIPTMSQLGD